MNVKGGTQTATHTSIPPPLLRPVGCEAEREDKEQPEDGQ